MKQIIAAAEAITGKTGGGQLGPGSGHRCSLTNAKDRCSFGSDGNSHLRYNFYGVLSLVCF